MGLVRIVVDANRNTGCSAQHLPVDKVCNSDRFGGCVRPSISSGSLLALQTVFSEQNAARLLESLLSSFRLQPLSF